MRWISLKLLLALVVKYFAGDFKFAKPSLFLLILLLFLTHYHKLKSLTTNGKSVDDVLAILEEADEGSDHCKW